MSATVQSIDANPAEAERELTDGFSSHHRCAQAQRASRRSTVCPAFRSPISAAWRRPKASVSSRSGNEQHAGNAAAIAGYLTKKPGICLTVVGARFPQRP